MHVTLCVPYLFMFELPKGTRVHNGLDMSPPLLGLSIPSQTQLHGHPSDKDKSTSYSIGSIKLFKLVSYLPGNNQITPDHPLLPTGHLPPLMQHTPISMPMQQRHTHLRRYRYRLRIRIRARRVWIEDRFAAGAGC